MSADVTALIVELVRLTHHSINGPAWKRLRIAVTSEEYESLIAHAHEARGEDFVNAIRGVALVVEPFPEEPELILVPRPRAKSTL